MALAVAVGLRAWLASDGLGDAPSAHLLHAGYSSLLLGELWALRCVWKPRAQGPAAWIRWEGQDTVRPCTMSVGSEDHAGSGHGDR